MFVKCLDGKIMPFSGKPPCVPVEYHQKPGEPVRQNRVEIDKEKKELCIEDEKLGRFCMSIQICKDKVRWGVADPISGKIACIGKPSVSFSVKKRALFIKADPFPFEYLIVKVKKCGGFEDELYVSKHEMVALPGWARVAVYTPAGGVLKREEFWTELTAVAAKRVRSGVQICGEHKGEPIAICCEGTANCVVITEGKVNKLIMCPNELIVMKWNKIIGWYTKNKISVF